MSSLLNGRAPDNDNGRTRDNVVAMPTLADRDRQRREAERLERARVKEPLINMPPATLSLLTAIIAVHLYMAFAASPEQAEWIMMHFGFVPTAFEGGQVSLLSLASIVTHMFLHGSWLHIAMNVFMLAAFGSGIERWLGSKRMLLLFFGSGLFGVAAHYALNASSSFPMIGASGGLSGLFAAAIVMLNRGQREMGGRIGILPFALIWIGLSIGFGMIGGPDGSMIAWAAHVGGFLGGFAVLKLMRV